MAHTVVVSDATDPGSATREEVLAAAGAEIVSVRADTADGVVEAAAGADALIVDARIPVAAGVIAALDSLRVVGRLGIGVDNIDVAAAAAAGVTVVNAPGYCTDEVSTHAVGLLLSCVRKLGRFDRSVRGGDWDRDLGVPMFRLAGKTVGLVAFGRIARAVAGKLSGFGVEVVAYDPYVDAAAMADRGVEPVGFDDLLARADAVSIHAPLTDETRGMFGRDEFAAMKGSAVLVNTARGPIVEEAALYEALASGGIAAAGLDVFESEPPGESPLFDLETVVLTPHVAWYSEESRRDRSRIVAEDVARVLRGDPPENPVDPDDGY